MWRWGILLLAALPASAASYFIELRENARMRPQFSLAFRGTVAELTEGEVAELRRSPDVIGINEDHAIDRFEPASTATAAAIVDARARVFASTLGARGQGITVAVIDSGIDLDHPALAVAGGYDFANNDPIPEDVEGHGTHVAGIIAANAADIAGVAPDVTLVVYKVVHINGDGKESSLVAALERAMDPNGDGDPSDRVDVVNISLGWDGGADSIGSRAVDAAAAAGIVVVVAAGNEGRALARVKAPGVAPGAITVANAISEVDVAPDSSRGPTPGTLAFKPDLAAPGENIISTFRGGGLATQSGTSMAAPHVAGVAALLRELHPEWTPAEVKAALVSSSRTMSATPLARGAGLADARAAHEAPFFIDVPGLSFGVNGAKSGTFDATRTFTVTNRSSNNATFSATPENTPDGANVSITPSSFTLAPNASRSVSVRVAANNAQLGFPSGSLIGGTIRLGPALRVPWGLLRSARATVTYDGAMATLIATSAARPRLFYQYAANAAEMYTAPGDAWDVVLISGDARVHVAERVRVDDDQRIAFTAADANRTFVLDARDASGTPLRTLPHHEVALRLQIDGSSLGGDLLGLGSVHEVRVTPHSPRFHFAPIETQLDASHAYAVVHPELTGDGATLTENDYRHARLRWPASRRVRVSAHAAYGGDATILLDSIETGPAVDVHLSPRASLGTSAALAFDSDQESLALLRATGDGISSGTHVAANGSEIAIGRGPAHPAGLGVYRGGFGETRMGDHHWQLFDAAGTLIASGTTGTPPIQPRSRYVATNNALRSVLEVAFGDSSDLTAPMLTSLRVLGANGALADRVGVGEAATLRLTTNGVVSRVWYRKYGTLAWIALPGIELATAAAEEALIDLRIELEDGAGNRTTWTQLAAFAVGGATAPPRRRAVR